MNRMHISENLMAFKEVGLPVFPQVCHNQEAAVHSQPLGGVQAPTAPHSPY